MIKAKRTKEEEKAYGNKYEVGHSIRAEHNCPTCNSHLVFRWVLMGNEKMGYWLDFREIEYCREEV